MSSQPSSPPDATGAKGQRSGFHWSPWNLLLLIPLLMLITPWFNFDKPRVFGLPFFYWYQFLWVIVGVTCVWIVYAMTRDKPGDTPPVIVDDDAADEEGGRR